MAQERTLGIASAPQREGEDLSKEELQRRMEEARESISETVTEIKETVAQQVETVKDALDWREYFKRQPVAWSLGALGVGFLTGYGLAAAVKGDSDERADDYRYSGSFSRPLVGERVYSELEEPGQTAKTSLTQGNGVKHDGPGLLERFKETSAYDRLSKEAGTIGDRLLDELSTTAQTVVLPLLIAKLKNWIGLDLSEKSGGASTGQTSQTSSPDRTRPDRYQPVLERPS
jgi:hypothetical protein